MIINISWIFIAVSIITKTVWIWYFDITKHHIQKLSSYYLGLNLSNLLRGTFWRFFNIIEKGLITLKFIASNKTLHWLRNEYLETVSVNRFNFVICFIFALSIRWIFEADEAGVGEINWRHTIFARNSIIYFCFLK